MTEGQRVNAVLDIVGSQHRATIARFVKIMMQTQADWREQREREKRYRNKRTAAEIETAAHRLIDLVERKAPAEWKAIDREQLLTQLKTLHAVCVTVRVGLGRQKPQPDATEQYLSAQTALTICRECGIKPTLTRGGNYLSIAAALHGDPKANLDHQCRWARDRSKRKTTSK